MVLMVLLVLRLSGSSDSLVLVVLLFCWFSGSCCSRGSLGSLVVLCTGSSYSLFLVVLWSS